PGGMLPSPERFNEKASQAGLRTTDQYHFGRDYAETLRRWRADWESEKAAISAQGFDEKFMRIWRLYFVYCEAGFDGGKTDVVQFLLHKD
ncbi:MAG: class I SAM-dependent methyltransferase, partial [Deefgea sp.]